jgi:hypothetical protein
MRAVGSAEEWIGILDSLVPQILGMIVGTWDSQPIPGAEIREDPITEKLCRALRQSRSSSELPLRIDLQMVELDPAEGETQGRLDIVFSPLAAREDIYFCLECKRLNVVGADGTIRPYASEYVTEGMFRFVRGRYASRVRQGGMLGYVLNGDIANAIQRVANAINTHVQALGMSTASGLSGSVAVPSDSRFRETTHSRPHSADTFRMHHIFMPAN